MELFQSYWERKNTTKTDIFRRCTSSTMRITCNRFRNASSKSRRGCRGTCCTFRQNDPLSHQSRPKCSCKKILELPTESNESAEPCFIWWFFHSFNCLLLYRLVNMKMADHRNYVGCKHYFFQIITNINWTLMCYYASVIINLWFILSINI